MNTVQSKRSDPKNRSQKAAALLSLLLPGVGQMYKGEFIKGLKWLIVVVATAFYAIIPAVLLNLLCVGEAFYGNRIEK